MSKNISVKSEPNIISSLPVKKVCCGNCKYFVDCSSLFLGINKWCGKVLSRVNIGECYTPEKLEEAIVLNIKVKDYRIQNKNNDCKYYKRIWYKFWV